MGFVRKLPLVTILNEMNDPIITFINIAVLLINSFLIYKTFFSERKRKFEDVLFDKKLKTYQEIIDRLYEISSKLDYSSEPFDSIHRFSEKSEWQKYCEKEVLPLISMGINLHINIQRDYGLLLPEKVLKIIDDFSIYATRMVVESHHFDGELIIAKQDKMQGKLFDLINVMRSDLGIEIIDESLRNRLKEKVI